MCNQSDQILYSQSTARNMDNIKSFSCIHIHIFIHQKGVYCLAIKIFNGLPSDSKNFSNNPKKFKTVLKSFLCTNSFYSLDEYFNVNEEKLDSYSYNEFCIRFSQFGLLFVKCFYSVPTSIYLVMHSIFYLILYKLY